MNKLTDLPNLDISIKNIKTGAEKSQRIGQFQRAKYLEFNKLTTSSIFNQRLIKIAIGYSSLVTPIPPTPAETTRASQLSLLKSACSSDADLLSYKGINLGSAINMKLAVKLGSLLGKQQG